MHQPPNSEGNTSQWHETFRPGSIVPKVRQYKTARKMDDNATRNLEDTHNHLS